MAKIKELELGTDWYDWVASRPECIQTMCRQFPPDRLYRIKNTGHRVTLYSYSEDNTMTVIVAGEYNLISFPRKVFGIKPDDLKECDLPPKCEQLGAAITDPDEIQEYMEHIKGRKQP